MKILALETSAKAVSAAVSENGRILASGYQDTGLTHSRTLMPIVEHILKNTDLKLSDMDAIAVAVGPGSFTGIRIGVSAVKGFCEGTGKPALGRTSFQVLAYNAEGKVLAVVPAGRGSYYVCGFDGEKRVSLAPAYVGEEKLKELSALYTVVSYEALPVPYVQADPAAGLLCAVRAAREEDLGDLAAFYLKKSQAEEERERREG